MKRLVSIVSFGLLATANAIAMPALGKDWVSYGHSAKGDVYYWMKSETRSLGKGSVRVWATIVLARVKDVSARNLGAGYLVRRYTVACPAESITLDVDNSYMFDDTPLIVFTIRPELQETVVPTPGTPEKDLIGLACAER